MADRITLDFETGMITWDTDSQKGTEYCLDLKERKAAILAAMGYEAIDIGPIKDAFEAFVNGVINEEELNVALDEIEQQEDYYGKA